MSLRDRLQEDMKAAMREKDVLRRDTLRMTISAMKNRQIDLGKELSEEDELAVVTKAVKSRQDSVEQYTAAGREDLADKERAEAEILKGYLPELLDEDGTRELVQGIVDELGLTSKKEMGQVMKAVMKDHRGKVDGKLVQKVAGEILG